MQGKRKGPQSPTFLKTLKARMSPGVPEGSYVAVLPGDRGMNEMSSGEHVDANKEMNESTWLTTQDYGPPTCWSGGLHKLSLLGCGGTGAEVSQCFPSLVFLSSGGQGICLDYSRDPPLPCQCFLCLVC